MEQQKCSPLGGPLPLGGLEGGPKLEIRHLSGSPGNVAGLGGFCEMLRVENS